MEEELARGLFLDGDETSAWPNPAPDRVAPWGPEAEGDAAGVATRSVYGLELRLLACEWTAERPDLGLILDVENGRYAVSVGPRRAGPRGREGVFRAVVDLPPDP